MDLDERLTAYLRARGRLDLAGGVAHGRKVLEEAGELIEALALGDAKQIRAELADVVLAASLVARAHCVSLEECIRDKTEMDRGRDAPN